MKITLDWLKRHLETDATLNETVAALDRIGLEVEGVEDRGGELAPFTVGLVTKAGPHPRADRLRVCMVETGGGAVQVVCGAPNARSGMKGVFAPAGSRIPGTGLDLKAVEIRGVESRGMLCSERELGLSDDHDSIVELAADAPVGASYARLAGLDDPVIDVAITPDRGDCFAVRGIARDLAAAGLGRLRPLDTAPVAGAYPCPLALALDFGEAARDACPAFIGRHFRGLANGPSPAWMQRKLKAIGLRPLSALVDITNWLTVDLGRPAHIYDADRLRNPVGARLARPGESLQALNDRSYALDGDMTVIVDAGGVLGLGGVVGGVATGAGPDTANGFLEIALFDPVRTAATGRRLGLVTDARQRFERGIDEAFAPAAMEIATRLVLEICGGEASEVVTAGTVPAERPAMVVRPSRVESLGGVAIARARAEAILADLGFAVADAGPDAWSVTAPSWRHDMQCEADVIEEILRIHGFDAIPMRALPRTAARPRAADEEESARPRAADEEGSARPHAVSRQAAATRPVPSAGPGRVRRVLAGRGLAEAVTYSFVARRQARAFGGGGGGLVLENPISSDMDTMRPSVLPGLLAAAARNRARGLDDVGLFEIGPVYGGTGVGDQKTAVAALRMGQAEARHWSRPARPVDLFDAEADALAALDAAGAPEAGLRARRGAPSWFHPGRSGLLCLGSKTLAVFGELHPAVVASFEAQEPVVAFELFLEQMPARRAASFARGAAALSPHRPVHRDFAFVVDAEVPADELLRAVRGADRALIGEVCIFDVYRGPELGPGRKSLALAVTLQPVEATLTDEALAAVGEKIAAAVARRTGGVLRGQAAGGVAAGESGQRPVAGKGGLGGRP